MGNAISSKATTISSVRQAAVRSTKASVARSCSPPNSGNVPSTPQHGLRIEGTDDWANLMRAMSGAISSSNWDNPSSTKRSENERHPAARGPTVISKLPQLRNVRMDDDVSESVSEKLMLNQAQIISVYKLRRTNPGKWDARALAARFGTSDADMSALLNYTRTYSAHSDATGNVRGYYDAHAVPPIERFENVEK